jgi:hypothetical protein
MSWLSNLDPTDKDSWVRGGLRAIDPTTDAGRRNIGYLVGMPGSGELVNRAIGGKDRPDWDSRADNRLTELAGEMGSPAYDQSIANDYYGTVAPQIDESFYSRSKDIASDYAKRGLSSSGMSAKDQTDEAFNRAAKLRQARVQAINYAKGQRRQQLVDEALMWNDWNDEQAAVNGLEQQDQAAKQAGLARLLGAAASLAG